MAYRRKLEALGYKQFNEFNVFSDDDFRSLVVWLEDQVIRQYPIEDRSPLRNITNAAWEDAFKVYLADLACPFTEKEEICDWLLGLAVRLEYGDNVDKFKSINTKNSDVKSANPQISAKNPLDNLDFESAEFKGLVKSLANTLNIAQHPDHLETLSAVCSVIKSSYSKTALESRQSKKSGKSTSVLDSSLEFESSDPVLNKAAKILRLCFVHDLRELQTKINEIIVSVQNVTANPKTDTRLGKVGR
ncbi:RNA transcription, translation and transport factor protein [Parasteatoda tepidariorum]|uniref:RNA transcription, translation and transport factor protein n=1 Tax=Parasteatoda tepidariorum TaxID=114398 RepID=A0A2L2XVB6_PARTP|nr:RNA transcription, translation and transport factor protein [Parasteatoda tepidariorum]